MKKVLIISPYFPPVNAPDMQRVRMSLPYFHKFGWKAEVVAVDEHYVDLVKEDLLLETLPPDVKITKVKALEKMLTAKLGLGSIALRSIWYFQKKVNELLSTTDFDLIYFSTTQFPICVLGAYWKKKFGIPYIIDFQDPWHSDYYNNKPKAQRPRKYWFSYRLNKYLEPYAVTNANGLVSVSDEYILTLKKRYPTIKYLPATTITFGSYFPDLAIALQHEAVFKNFFSENTVNIVYIGRGGTDMHQSIRPVFSAFRNGLLKNSLLSKIRFYFIGTSYAAAGQGHKSIQPLAKEFGIDPYVTEMTDRISYFQTLFSLKKASAIFIPGSDDPGYTASKIYPYLLVKRPVLAVFHKKSSAIRILREFGVRHVYDFEHVSEDEILHFFSEIIGDFKDDQSYNQQAIERYSAEQMTKEQCLFFDLVLKNNA